MGKKQAVQRLKEKKYGIMIFLLAFVFLLAKGKGVDRILSEIVGTEGTSHFSNAAQDMEALGEILEGDVLCQPLYLERGAKAVGVRVGTYMRENTAGYVFTILDQDGNILGKREILASGIEDNQTIYINLYGRIGAGKSYRMMVEASGTAPGNAVTCYGVPIMQGHSGLTWNGKEAGLEMVTDIIYQIPFQFVKYLFWMLAFLFCVYFFQPEIKRAGHFLGNVALGFIKKWHKAILLGCILLGIAGVLLLLLFPQRRQMPLLDSIPDENDAVAVEYSGKWSQEIVATEAFDGIGIKLGTYMAAYQEGSLVLAIYNTRGTEPLFEKRIPAGQIRDNEYLQVGIGGDGLKPGTYSMELWMEGFEGQKMALYCTEGGDSLIFRLMKEERQYAWAGIVGFALLAALAGMGYFYLFAGLRKGWKDIVAVAFFSILAGIFLNTYANYHGFSLAALAKNLGLPGEGETVVVGQEEIEEATERTVRYNYHGSINSIFDQIHIQPFYRRADSITLYLSGEGNDPVTHTVFVYTDTGNGYSEETRYEYNYSGQGSIRIPVKELKEAESLILSFACYDGSDDLISGIHQKWYSLEKIVFNETPIQLKIFSWAFLVGFFFVWLVYFWQRFKMEERIKSITKNGKNAEGKFFIPAALLFGILMIVLLPAMQVPDEGTHMRWTFASIGAESVYGEISTLVLGAEKEVMNHGGVRVDSKLYLKEMGRHLSEYPSSFSLDFSVIKYPGAAFGAFLGLLFRLPVGGILFLSEFMALLLYIAIGSLAIKVTPVKKKLFVLILLLPMAMQQAASYSYDSFNNAVAILAIAYFLHLSLEKERVGLADIVKAAGMLFILLYIKKIYVMCGLLLLLIPYHKLPMMNWLVSKGKKALDKKWKKLCAAFCTAGIIVACVAVAFRILPGILGLEGTTQSLLSAIRYPKELFVLCGKTVFDQLPLWIEWFSASFGWLDGTTANWIIWLVFIEMFLAALWVDDKKENQMELNWKHYLLHIGTFLLISLLVILSMFGWTQIIHPVAGDIQNRLLLFIMIEGVQGRYFIPIIVLLFLFPIRQKTNRIMAHLPVQLCLIGGWLVMVAYTAVTLLERYWI